MRLKDYHFIAGKSGTSGVLDISKDIDVLSKHELEKLEIPYNFSGGSVNVPILIDLGKQVKIDRINITFAGDITNIENVEFSVREEEKDKYQKIKTLDVDLNTVDCCISATARYIKLIIYKELWTKLIPNIEIYGTELSDKNDILSVDEYKIEWMKSSPKVDKYGQYLYEDWSGKIYTDDDLVSRYNEEKEYLKDIDNTKYQHDEYGGIIDGNNYGGTGFFRTQKIDGKWWLITPIGNKFIMKGIEAVDLFNGPGLSRVYYAGTDTIRSVYSELPDLNDFPEAYCYFGKDKGKSVSLLLTNVIKKYGRENYLKIWREITLRRLKKWNFNTHSKWTKDEEIKMPYVCSTGLNDKKFSMISYAPDPYDCDFENNVYEAVREKVLTTRNDPLLIGYHFTNESGWTHLLVKKILESDEKLAAKKAFVEYISEKYTIQEISEKISERIESFEQLKNKSLQLGFFDSEEIDEFIFRSSKKFHSIVQKVFKDLAPNHLYMGGGLPGSTWRNSIPWTEGSVDYCDVITFDRYTKENAVYLEPYLHIDKPMANIEWSFITNQRGYNGGAIARVMCNNQSERAELYKEFIESHMKLPQMVGMGWFLYYDQPLTGRALGSDENAECYNFGLVDMQDTPYYDFVDKIALVNDELEKIHENG